MAAKKWCPQKNSNLRFQPEKLASLASRRWGRIYILELTCAVRCGYHQRTARVFLFIPRHALQRTARSFHKRFAIFVRMSCGNENRLELTWRNQKASIKHRRKIMRKLLCVTTRRAIPITHRRATEKQRENTSDIINLNR